MFIPSLIYHFYSPGQLLMPYDQFSTLINNEIANEGWRNVLALHWQTKDYFSMYKDKFYEIWEWNVILVMPII